MILDELSGKELCLIDFAGSILNSASYSDLVVDDKHEQISEITTTSEKWQKHIFKGNRHIRISLEKTGCIGKVNWTVIEDSDDWELTLIEGAPVGKARLRVT